MGAISTIRRILPLTTVAVLIAGAYAGWTLYSRAQARKAADREAIEKRAKADREIVEIYGGGNVKIMTFYASPPGLAKGQQGLICFGVANAKAVRIEPLKELVTPSVSRCLEVRPEKTTSYTLTATGADGKTATQTIEIPVR